jgi:transcriptional regulator of acetoin/glycerol metabolism
MLADLGAAGTVRFTAATFDVLVRQAWPGNLAELRSVVAVTLTRRSSGDVTPEDLPPAYARPGRAAELTPLQAAECDAIERALRVCGGNKLAAAQMLPMSRTTLYKRMRDFGLPG